MVGLALGLARAEGGRPVTYGIRPEDIAIGEGGTPVRVVVVEPMGAETQVFAKAGDDLIDAVVKARIRARAGEELPFLIDAAKAHLFDRQTGQRL